MDRGLLTLHLPTVAWGLLTALLLLLPVEPVPSMPQRLDKLGHLILFLVLAWLLLRSFSALAAVKSPMVLAVLVAVLYGGLLEVVQGWVGYREAEWWDLVADVLGVGIFVAVRVLLRSDRPND